MMVTVVLLAAVLFAVSQLVTGISRNSNAAAEDPYEEAQEAFETMAGTLATATLASYQDYADSSGAFRTGTGVGFVPDHIARRSDLDFVCGPASGLLSSSRLTTAGGGVFFVAPNGYTQTCAHEGLEHLLNAIGYYVEFGTDSTPLLPSFIPAPSQSYRWRLKQIVQPAESLQIFANPVSSAQWLAALVPAGTSAPVLAENVILLVVLPERAANDPGSDLAPGYSYDSRDTTNLLTLHQLPPRVRLVIVAIDPIAAARLAAQDGATAPQLVPATLFQQDTQLDADLATLDASLTALKINHRIFQREISLTSSEWSDTPSP